MSRYPRLMPTSPRLFSAEVSGTERISPSFQRVTVTGTELTQFTWLGLDQWFRLFLPPAPGADLVLPHVSGRTWWTSYLAIPAAHRPHCANYTVTTYRAGRDTAELDIDVVLHGHDGELGGTVARWATSAVPGSPIGLLDQGALFDPPPDTTSYLFAADETGLPGVRGVLRDLAADAVGEAFIEVPTSADVSTLAAPPALTVHWIPRDDPARKPGATALEAVQSVTPPTTAYAFIMGESGLATGGRRALRRAGLAASRITFSGFWKA